jgi:hypothetical protein
VWSPIRYAGSYGTNGFYLNFSDNSDVTATTLGADYSGNGNNWTPSGSPGFSVTAGAGNDSLVDSPTPYGTDTGAGGQVRGNYATLNPLNNTTTLSNGNLQSVSTTDNWLPVVGTFGMSSGKWYWEIVMTAQTDYIMIGIVPPTYRAVAGTYPGSTSSGGYGYFNNNGNLYNGVSNSNAAYGATYTLNDVIGVALDMDAGTLTFYKNGVSQGTAVSGLSGTFLPAFGNYRVTGVANFGQRPFEDTAPSGFKALVTTNLPDPTVVQGDDYFNTALYTGNNTTNAITGLGFSPDLVWIKSRSSADPNLLFDTNRGRGLGLYSNLTNAEAGPSPSDKDLISFDSDGFTLGQILNFNVNDSGKSFVGWAWRGSDSSAVTNGDGTIDSTVSVSTTSGFSIVTYTGTGSAGTVGHGLGSAPKMIILKGRTNTDQWFIWHNTFTSSQYIYFNTTAVVSGANPWNNTLPTDTLFSLGTDGGVNGNTTTYVAYCFAEVEGFSKFGSFTGNGSADGPFVYTGFRPAFFLYKKSSSTSDWWMFDAARNTYNVVSAYLFPDLSNAEGTENWFDFTANGLKMRDRTDLNTNGSGSTYIYAAFAENPFKYSLAR